MARLQRKKSREEKRKKRQTQSSEATGPSSENSVSSSSSSVTAPGVVKKKPPVAQKRELAEARAKSEQRGKLSGWFHQAGQFIREAKVELKKVAWPSRKQTIGSTVVVLILVFAIAAFLGLADMVLAQIVRWVLQ